MGWLDTLIINVWSTFGQGTKNVLNWPLPGWSPKYQSGAQKYEISGCNPHHAGLYFTGQEFGFLIFTRPILQMGRVYKLKWTMCVCLSVCLSVITSTFPLKTLFNHFRCFTDPQNHCLVDVWWCLVVSGGVWSMSGGVLWCLMQVWWCLVVSMYIG